MDVNDVLRGQAFGPGPAVVSHRGGKGFGTFGPVETGTR